MLVSWFRGLHDAYIGECPYSGEIHTGDFRMILSAVEVSEGFEERRYVTLASHLLPLSVTGFKCSLILC